MCDLTALDGLSADRLGSLVKHIQLGLWMEAAPTGRLSLAGLMDARARLDSREFDCDHALAAQLAVCDALAVIRGMPVEDDPLYREIVPEVPDTPEDWPPPAPSRW